MSLISSLEKNNYLPVKGKLKKFITDIESPNVYVKTIERILEYTDNNDKIVFKTAILLGQYIVVEEDKIQDSFIVPLNQFRMRTKEDIECLNEALQEFQEDLENMLDEDIVFDA